MTDMDAVAKIIQDWADDRGRDAVMYAGGPGNKGLTITAYIMSELGELVAALVREVGRQGDGKG